MKRDMIVWITITFIGFIAIIFIAIYSVIFGAIKINFKIISAIYIISLFIIISSSIIHKAILKFRKSSYQKNVLLEDIPVEFEKIYEELYKSKIASLEKMRKRVMWRKIIQYISFISCGVGYIGEKICQILITMEMDTTILISKIGGLIIVKILGLIIGILFTIWNRKYKKIYAQTYKKEIIDAFIKLINNQLDYNPLVAESNIIEADYMNAKFDNKEYNRFYADDYLEGFVNEENFIKMCDLNIQYYAIRGKYSRKEEIFQGIFAQTRCGKNIGTYVKISKNKVKILKKSDTVEMDSREFEKYFDIYSENRVIAMQILTSDIMESLIEFYNKYKLDYEIVFRNNTVYMRFFTGAMFEPEIFANSMEKKLLFIYYFIFKFVVDFSSKINNILREVEV